MAIVNYSSKTTDALSIAALPADGKSFLGHPAGLFLLFTVEMWERFSYYGMRALLVLYLSTPTTGMRNLPFGRPVGFNPGRGWSDAASSTLYGWYTGLAYLLPVLGGIIADKLIGTHRSMLIGGLVIAMGHIALAVSGMGTLGQSELGMAVFIFGLALIVLGTGHFKPTVSVMVGQLYAHNDLRRDGAFSIFYMGINLGAFLCAFVCGTLGETVGWHWGFGSAAVGMLAGLLIYTIGRPALLGRIGEPPPGVKNYAPLFILSSIIVAAGVALVFHAGAFSAVQVAMAKPLYGRLTYAAFGVGTLSVAVIGLAAWFVAYQHPDDRGPVTAIFLFMFFNVFFWMAFEQAGSSINLFTDRFTDRALSPPAWYVGFCTTPARWTGAIIAAAGLLATAWFFYRLISQNAAGKVGRASLSLCGCALALCIATVGVLKAGGCLSWAAMREVPTTWFQSVNAGMIILFAPVFGGVWVWLGRRNLNPSQPAKIAFGLLFLGLGYVVLTWGAAATKAGVPGVTSTAKASMIFIIATYLMHTFGELCLSPTGLSFVTRAAPVRFVSLLMGIWFISSFIANLGGGLIAAQVGRIERGEIPLPWHLGGQADFFMLFVVTSIGMGVLIMIFVPLLKKLLHGRE
jgi:POT family proton-dependent oligopeptide transporter